MNRLGTFNKSNMMNSPPSGGGAFIFTIPIQGLSFAAASGSSAQDGDIKTFALFTTGAFKMTKEQQVAILNNLDL